MTPIARLGTLVSSVMVRNRHRLPRFLNRIIDDVARNPDGRMSRLASRVLGGSGRAPAATSIPVSPTRLFIGPTNYAGQGYAWARAVEASSPRIGARNLSIDLPGGFAFPADSTVPISIFNHSEPWQRAEFDAVVHFTHVLVEAERPLFGSFFGRDLDREIDELQRRGLSCAFMCHGTDIRSPALHLSMNEWSPFVAGSEQTRALQHDADSNLALLARRHLVVFVSTPDLLVDVPTASWCPVVVDVDRWVGGRALWTRDRPVVVHVPSMGSVKGTDLIEPTMRRLDKAGVIEYRSVTGVPSSRMPLVIGDADIVLDQFRIGSYGVAAVEAMAAGRIVVGHVGDETREAIRRLTGMDLPVVEADPTTLGDVLEELVAKRPVAMDGIRFASTVHSGALSASVLRRGWIDVPAS